MDTLTSSASRQSNSENLRRQDQLISQFIDTLEVPSNRIDTHASSIIVTGDWAYKIKRPVHYAYLDYSTLETRKAACEHEFAINAAISPDLYDSVVCLYEKPNGEIAIAQPDTDGAQAIEWAIKMRRFDEADLFSNLADTNQLSHDDIIGAARLIAAMHLQAKPIEPDTDAPHGGGATGLNQVACDVIYALTHEYDTDMAPILSRAAISLSAQIASFHEKLDNRLADGLVRECHGDLHLGNICRFNDRPTLFDAVEFSHYITDIDCMYDMAFLLMDLINKGKVEEANCALNTYLPYFGRYNEACLLGLMMALRALVRAMVGYARASLLPNIAEQQSERQAARNYIQLSEKLLSPSQPSLIAIGGLSGTGKSSLASVLAPRIGNVIGAIHLRSDVIRKIQHNVDPLSPLPDTAYTEEATKQVYKTMLDQARDCLSAGMPVVLDATFSSQDDCNAAAMLAQEMGVPFSGLWLEAPLDLRIERINNRGADASDADETIARKQESTATEPDGWLSLISSGTYENLLTKAVKCLHFDGHRVALDLDQSESA